MSALAIAGAGAGLGILGQYFQRRAAERDAAARRAATEQYQGRMGELLSQRAQLAIGEGERRANLFSKGAGAAANMDFAGANQQATEQEATALGAVEGDLSARGKKLAGFASQGRIAQDTMGGAQLGAQQAGMQADASTTAGYGGFAGQNLWNNMQQQEAENDLNLALGAGSSGASRDQLIAGLLSGFGGLGMQYGALSGGR